MKNIHQITQRLVQDGHRPIYLRKCLYPVLKVTVSMLERSREEMGELQQTLLNLIGAGITLKESLSALIGLAPGRLLGVLEDLQGRSLIATQGEQIVVTELGRESLKVGAVVSQTRRALLLCGLTGKLLPAKMYESDLLRTDEIRKPARYADFIMPVLEVPLTGLDLDSIANKRAFALPDEAMQVLGVLESEPFFLQGILAVSSDEQNNLSAKVHTPYGDIDWIAPDDVIPLIEPVGHSAKRSEHECLEDLERELAKSGLTVECELVGTPPVITGTVTQMTDKAGEHKHIGRSIFHYIGTEAAPALPIGSYPQGKDLLYGHCLYLQLAASLNSKDVYIIRSFSESLRCFWQTPRANRPRLWQEFVSKELFEAGYDQRAIKDCLNNLQDTKLQELVEYLEESCDLT